MDPMVFVALENTRRFAVRVSCFETFLSIYQSVTSFPTQVFNFLLLIQIQSRQVQGGETCQRELCTVVQVGQHTSVEGQKAGATRRRHCPSIHADLAGCEDEN